MNKLRTIAALLAALILVLPLAGCGQKADETAANSQTSLSTANAAYDYDYASLSAAEEYAKMLPVCNDLKNSNLTEYMGKTVHLTGEYLNSGYNFLVIFLDATRCCFADFELQYAGKYPEAGSQIEVTGSFGSYTDSDGTWPCINVDSMTVLAPPAAD